MNDSNFMDSKSFDQKPEPGQPTEAIPVREAAQLKLPSHGWKIPARQRVAPWLGFGMFNC
jgi:hypothetical protein